MNKFSSYEQVVGFHGHSCPGLAMGYRLTVAALDHLNVSPAEDEELTVIVENDACGTDAVQYVSGCTFGKGNFIFKDLGKMAYSFFNRKTESAIRVLRKNSFRNELDKMDLNRAEKIEYILQCPESILVEFLPVEHEIPDKAELYENDICAVCGESVMKPRMIKTNKGALCISCAGENEIND
ncbi:FmdE family protein [Candidatus Cloacimonadota bacterium]